MQRPATSVGYLALRQNLAGIQEQRQSIAQFESNVAQAYPEQALPQYQQAAYAEVQSTLQPKMQSLQESISNKQQQIEQIKQANGGAISQADNREIRAIEREIRVDQARLNEYQATLNLTPTQALQRYNSGQTEALAEYKAARLEASYARSQAKSEAAAEIQKEYPGMNYTREEALRFIESSKNQGAINQIANLKGINAGEALDIARGMNLVETPVGAKPQGTLTLTNGQYTYMPNIEASSYKPIYDSSGKLTGIEDYNLGMSLPIAEVERLSAVTPKEVYKNVLTGEISQTKTSPFFLKGYTTPEGKFLNIDELSTYLKENRIPIRESKATTPEQLRKSLEPNYYGATTPKQYIAQTVEEDFQTLFGNLPEKAQKTLKYLYEEYPLLTLPGRRNFTAEQLANTYLGQTVKEFGISIAQIGKTMYRGFEKTVEAGTEGVPYSLAYNADKGVQNMSKELMSNTYLKNYQKNFNENYKGAIADVNDPEIRAFIMGSALIGAQFVPGLNIAVDTAFAGQALYKSLGYVKEGKIPTPKEAAELLLLGTPLIAKGSKFLGERFELFPEGSNLPIKYLKKLKIQEEIVPSILYGKTLGKIRGARIIPKVIDEAGKELGYLFTEFKGKKVYGSIGGAIEKGETPIQAAIREGLEETGMKFKQENLNLLKVEGNPQEIAYFYTTTLRLADVEKLRATDDITNFKIITSERIGKILDRYDLETQPRFIRTTPFSQTAYNLFDLDFGIKLRLDEAKVVSKIDELTKINKEIGKLSPSEVSALAKIAEEKFTKQFGSKFSKKFYSELDLVRELKLEEKGLLPTISYFKSPAGKTYILSSSAYDFDPKALDKIIKEKQIKGIYSKSEVNFEGEYRTLTSTELKNQILKISKKIDEKKYNKASLVFSGSAEESKLTNGKLVVLPQYFKRGEKVLFFTPPVKETAEGLTSIDYLLGYGKSETRLSLLPKSAKPELRFGNLSKISEKQYNLLVKLKETYQNRGLNRKQVYNLLKEDVQNIAKSGQLTPTAKALLGIEREFGEIPFSQFSVKSVGRISLEGRSIKLKRLTQEKSLEIEQPIINKLKKENKIEKNILESEAPRSVKYKSAFEELNKIGLNNERIKSIPTKEQIKYIIKEKNIETLNKERVKKIIRERTASQIKEKNIATIGERSLALFSYNEPTIYKRTPETPRFYEGYLYPPINRTKRIGLGYPSEKDKKKKKQAALAKAYAVLLKRRGKFQAIGTGFTRGQALKFGSEKALQDISRTFKIVETGKTTEAEDFGFAPSQNIFREYKIRDGKRVATPGEFIQLTSANLQSRAEKFQLQEARRLNQFMNVKKKKKNYLNSFY